MSIVGALAWLVLARADLAVYVSALRRRLKQPWEGDIRRANAVLSYAKKEKVGLRFRKIGGEIVLAVASDAAFRALEAASSGLAVRGFILRTKSKDSAGAGGKRSPCLIFAPGSRSVFAGAISQRRSTPYQVLWSTARFNNWRCTRHSLASFPHANSSRVKPTVDDQCP